MYIIVDFSRLNDIGVWLTESKFFYVLSGFLYDLSKDFTSQIDDLKLLLSENLDCSAISFKSLSEGYKMTEFLLEMGGLRTTGFYFVCSVIISESTFKLYSNVAIVWFLQASAFFIMFLLNRRLGTQFIDPFCFYSLIFLWVSINF